MKISSKTLLAAALLTVLPMGSAMACSISNWNGSNTAADANAGSPPSIARYSGKCGLSVDSGKYVVDNSPNGEQDYRARFYVLTKGASGNVTVFKATANDNGGGAEVLRVEFTGSAFNFFQNGNQVGTVNGIQANKWYSVEVAYDAGTSFSAQVAGAANFSGQVNPVTSGIGSGTIGSSVLGVSSGTATGMGFDAFVSTRAVNTPIGRLCRGDANGDGAINVFDAAAVTAERATGTLATGQPDCNEDGTINVFDRACIVQLRTDNATCN